jgi:hypothetical protein
MQRTDANADAYSHTNSDANTNSYSNADANPVADTNSGRSRISRDQSALWWWWKRGRDTEE